MPNAYAGVSTYHSTVTEALGGDARNAASVTDAIKQLADRSTYLKDLHDSGQVRVRMVGDEEQMTLIPASDLQSTGGEPGDLIYVIDTSRLFLWQHGLLTDKNPVVIQHSTASLGGFVDIGLTSVIENHNLTQLVPRVRELNRTVDVFQVDSAFAIASPDPDNWHNCSGLVNITGLKKNDIIVAHARTGYSGHADGISFRMRYGSVYREFGTSKVAADNIFAISDRFVAPADDPGTTQIGLEWKRTVGTSTAGVKDHRGITVQHIRPYEAPSETYVG